MVKRNIIFNKQHYRDKKINKAERNIEKQVDKIIPIKEENSVKQSKYNIIANDCTGGFVYNLLGMKYQNPFIWIDMYTINDFCNLVENYDTINFKNYRLIINKTLYKNVIPKNCYVPQIIIDNKITFNYSHHLCCEEIDELKEVQKTRLASKNILQYIEERYNRQIDRMLKSKIEPIFVFNEWGYNGFFNKETIKKIVDIETKYRILIATYQNIETSKKNIQTININGNSREKNYLIIKDKIVSSL